MTDARAEMLAAAERARAAWSSSGHMPPPASRPRRPRSSPAAQPSLWDAMVVPTPVPPASPEEPHLSPLRAALRQPVQPCPDLPKSGRNPTAIREGIAVSDTEAVVRVALDGETSLYFLAPVGEPFDGGGPMPVRSAAAARRTDLAARAVILRACPETAGASCSQGCVVVNRGGPTAADAGRAAAWLRREAERYQAAMQAMTRPKAGSRCRCHEKCKCARAARRAKR